MLQSTFHRIQGDGRTAIRASLQYRTRAAECGANRYALRLAYRGSNEGIRHGFVADS